MRLAWEPVCREARYNGTLGWAGPAVSNTRTADFRDAPSLPYSAPHTFALATEKASAHTIQTRRYWRTVAVITWTGIRSFCSALLQRPSPPLPPGETDLRAGGTTTPRNAIDGLHISRVARSRNPAGAACRRWDRWSWKQPLSRRGGHFRGTERTSGAVLSCSRQKGVRGATDRRRGVGGRYGRLERAVLVSMGERRRAGQPPGGGRCVSFSPSC